MTINHWMKLATVSLLLATGCGKPVAAPNVPPPQVEVTPVVQKDVPIIHEWVATVDGFVNAQIQPQVSGYLLRQTYREGSFVKKGQVLFEIDPRTSQVSLEQAQGQLAQAKAQEVKARQDVERDRPLAQARAIAQSQVNAENQALLAAQAVVRAQEALSAMRYKGGATSYLEVRTSETNHLSAELSLAQARSNELQAMVQLYKALGGGWQEK